MENKPRNKRNLLFVHSLNLTYFSGHVSKELLKDKKRILASRVGQKSLKTLYYACFGSFLDINTIHSTWVDTSRCTSGNILSTQPVRGNMSTTVFNDRKVIVKWLLCYFFVLKLQCFKNRIHYIHIEFLL